MLGDYITMLRKQFWRRSVGICLGLALFAVGCSASGQELSLDIVANTTQRQEGKVHGLFASDAFYVVLTNTSKKPIRILEDWSSWGWHGLSFEADGRDGKTYKIEREPAGSFLRNFPGVFEIRPGGHYVFAVTFDMDHWPSLEALTHTGQNRFQIRAVFTESDKGGDLKVWRGRVKSIPRWFSI